MTANRPSLKRIRSAANVYFGTDVGVKGRERNLVRSRQITQYVAHKIFKYNSSDTGFEIGRKDHATVLHACNTIENEIELYPNIARKISELINKCKFKEPIGDSPKDILLDVIAHHQISIHSKIELRRVLKLLRDESN